MSGWFTLWPLLKWALHFGNLFSFFLACKDVRVLFFDKVHVRLWPFSSPTDSTFLYSLEKWLHHRIYCPSNRSKQIKETHKAYSAGTQYTQQSLNEKQPTWLYRSWSHACCFSFKLCPCILCIGAISCVCFFDLFGPIAGAINSVM